MLNLPDQYSSEMFWNEIEYYLSTKQISTRDDLAIHIHNF